MPPIEIIGLIIAGLLLTSVIASKVSNKVSSLGGVSFEDPAIAKFIGDLALILISVCCRSGSGESLVSLSRHHDRFPRWVVARWLNMAIEEG